MLHIETIYHLEASVISQQFLDMYHHCVYQKMNHYALERHTNVYKYIHM